MSSARFDAARSGVMSRLVLEEDLGHVSGSADYITVDLNIRSNADTKGWTFSGGVQNLFNADAREPLAASVSIANDLPLPKRTFFLQAVYRM